MTIPLANFNEVADALGQSQTINGIEFYPIKLLDIEVQQLCNMIFAYSRSQMYDMNGIEILEKKIEIPWLNVYLSQYQKSINPDGYECLFSLKKLLCSICHIEDGNRIIIGVEDGEQYSCDSCENKEIWVVFIVGDEDNQKVIKFSGEDFDTIRYFIMTQNGLDIKYVDEWNKSFEEDLSYFINSQSKVDEIPSLSENIFTYKAMAQLPYSEIKDMTVKQFTKGYKKSRQILDYKLKYNFIVKQQIKEELRDYGLPQEQSWRYSSILQDKNEWQKTNPINNKK